MLVKAGLAARQVRVVRLVRLAPVLTVFGVKRLVVGRWLIVIGVPADLKSLPEFVAVAFGIVPSLSKFIAVGAAAVSVRVHEVLRVSRRGVASGRVPTRAIAVAAEGLRGFVDAAVAGAVSRPEPVAVCATANPTCLACRAMAGAAVLAGRRGTAASGVRPQHAAAGGLTASVGALGRASASVASAGQLAARVAGLSKPGVVGAVVAVALAVTASFSAATAGFSAFSLVVTVKPRRIAV